MVLMGKDTNFHNSCILSTSTVFQVEFPYLLVVHLYPWFSSVSIPRAVSTSRIHKAGSPIWPTRVGFS